MNICIWKIPLYTTCIRWKIGLLERLFFSKYPILLLVWHLCKTALQFIQHFQICCKLSIFIKHLLDFWSQFFSLFQHDSWSQFFGRVANRDEYPTRLTCRYPLAPLLYLPQYTLLCSSLLRFSHPSIQTRYAVHSAFKTSLFYY